MSEPPSVLIVGGPNGAGKTTISRAVVAETLGIAEFVNADIIAQGLSGFDPDRSAIQAGRIMLARMRELAATRSTFAFETTLASRTFAPWIESLLADGYEFYLVFVWLRSAELAVRRVARRVRQGGHAVPAEVIRRRYGRGISNFVRLYMPLTTHWRVYDNSNSSPGGPALVARGRAGEAPVIVNASIWKRILDTADAQATRQDDQ
jgi:predicted ABC-type ATPase